MTRESSRPRGRRVPRQRDGRRELLEALWLVAAMLLALVMAVMFWTVLLVVAVRGLPLWDW